MRVSSPQLDLEDWELANLIRHPDFKWCLERIDEDGVGLSVDNLVDMRQYLKSETAVAFRNGFITGREFASTTGADPKWASFRSR